MLLALDIGNTNIKIGIFDGEKLIDSRRLSTDRTKTSDEYGLLLLSLLSAADTSVNEITGVIMSSVVPAINYTMEHMLMSYIGKKPLVVGAGIKTGLNIKTDTPRSVGGDLICDAVAAFRRYGGPCITIDFGTATTLSYISASGEFCGGCILTGVKVSIDALTSRASLLSPIELTLPDRVICKNTASCMQAGLLLGYVGQIEYLVSRIRAEAGTPEAKTIATGGMARSISGRTDAINVVDPNLTLEGLRLIYNMNN